MTLGINTCFAVKRWPRPDDWAPIVRDRLGLTVIQHSLDLVDLSAPGDDRLTQAAAVRDAVTRAGLTLHSTFTGLAAYSDNLLLHHDADRLRAARRWYRRAIDWSAEAGARGTGGHVGALSVPDAADPVIRAGAWGRLQRDLVRLARRARLRGLQFLLVENLATAREPATMAQIESLLSDGDGARVPVRLCLDVGHMVAPGTHGADRDPYAWLRRLGPRAEVIQLQQSDARADHHWPFTPAHDRAGRIDPGRVIEALADGGTTAGLLVIEVIPPHEERDSTVLDGLVASADRWREALAQRGVMA
ncbi:MAG TPA: TIM barrel protein [Candidatus Sulfotelmatobacter sp.]|nr:TIM barrel protein [Candidatus Sulfotelmatobacter sp.]